MADYAAGMHRAAEIARSIGQMGRNCGQAGDGPGAADAIAAAIEAEADEELTPPAGLTVCRACGSVIARSAR